MSKSKEEQLIEHLEQATNFTLMSEFSGGDEPSEADMQLIENVKIKHNLNEGVMNVLIYYVMLRSDLKLNTQYTNKIAAHWARLGVKTVKEAMDTAKREQKEYQSWTLKKKSAASLESLSKDNEFLRNRVEGLEQDVYLLKEQLKQLREEFNNFNK